MEVVGRVKTRLMWGAEEKWKYLGADAKSVWWTQCVLYQGKGGILPGHLGSCGD